MQTIEIKNRFFKVPQNWNELNTGQLVQVVRYLTGGHELQKGRYLLLKALLQCTNSFWNRLTVFDAEDFLYTTDFLTQLPDLTRQLLPSRKGRFKTFVGPADNFNNLKMCEFVFAEDYYLRLKEEKNNTWLNNLVAVLYRPKRTGYNHKVNAEYDSRKPFNENECLHYASGEISRWPVVVKTAILFWYEGSRRQLMADFPNVFRGSGGGEPAKYGLLSLMRNVAQSGVHGNFKDIENMFIRMVMVELDEMTIEAEQIKKMSTKI